MKIVWKHIPVVSVEDGDARIGGPYRIETTWGAATGYTRKWVLLINGRKHGVYPTRKAAKAAAQAHADDVEAM